MAPIKGKARKVRVLAPLDFSKITVAKVDPGPEMTSRRPTRGVREPEQRQIDELVRAGWMAWDEAGRPTVWDDQPGTFLSVPTAAVETVKTRVGRAAQYLKMSVRYGRIETTGAYSEVVFTVTEPKPPKPKDKGNVIVQDGPEA